MKLKHTSLAALAAITLAGSASAATTISYSYYTATSSTDTSWVSPTGSTSVKAVNFGGAETSFGSVTWLKGYTVDGTWGTGAYNNEAPITMAFVAQNVGWANSTSGFYSGGPDLLNDGASSVYAGGSGPTDYTLEVNGLTVGTQYLLQFVFADTNATPGGSTISIDNYSANIAASADSLLTNTPTTTVNSRS